EYMPCDSLAAATQVVQHAVAAVGQVDDFLAVLQDRVAGAERIGYAQDLDLRAHDGPRAGGLESAVCAGDLGHVGSRRHDGRFFDGHRNEHVGAVDPEISGHSIGQLESPEHILDHAVGCL